jgi:CheY-like chemotaxis protein
MNHKLRILLLEDNADTLKWLTIFLRGLGHEVVPTCECQQALGAVRSRKFDVFLSDIGLPDGTGWDLIQTMGDDRPPFAMAMSGFGTLTDRERSKAAGFAHHLVKPFLPDKVKTILERVEAQRETAQGNC